MQFCNYSWEILTYKHWLFHVFKTQSQLFCLPIACSLYLQAKKLVVDEEHDNHLDTLSVQSKLKDSVALASGCRIWHRLLIGCNPGQLSFIFCAASDILPTSVNLKHWHKQCGTCYTNAHGCRTSLKQGHFTYNHNWVLQWLTAKLYKFFSTAGTVLVYTMIFLQAILHRQPSHQFSWLPACYCPDIVLHNWKQQLGGIIRTKMLSVENLGLKARKENQELQSECDCLRVPCFYDTIELSILGHYMLLLIQDEVKISKSSCRRIFWLGCHNFVFIFKNFHGQRLLWMLWRTLNTVV